MSSEFWKNIKKHVEDKVLDTSRYLLVLEDSNNYTLSIKKEAVTKYRIESREMSPVATFFTELLGKIHEGLTEEEENSNNDSNSEEESPFCLPDIIFDKIYKDDLSLSEWEEIISGNEYFITKIKELEPNINEMVKKICNDMVRDVYQKDIFEKWVKMINPSSLFSIELMIIVSINHVETWEWDHEWKMCLEYIANEKGGSTESNNNSYYQHYNSYEESEILEKTLKRFLEIFAREKRRNRDWPHTTESQIREISDNSRQILQLATDIKKETKKELEKSTQQIKALENKIVDVEKKINEQTHFLSSRIQTAVQRGSFEKFAIYSALVMLFILIIVNIFSSKKVKYNKI